MILALDTCLDSFSVALTEHDRCLAEIRGGRPKTHLTQLFPALQRVLEVAGVELSDLSAVAVTVGPGSFTGVRLGVLAARTLGQTRGLPLVGVSTLEALALNCPAQEVSVAVDVRRGQVCWARYRTGAGRPAQLLAPDLAPGAQWVVQGVVLGNALAAYPQPQAHCLPWDSWQVRASQVGLLGHLLLQQGQGRSWQTLLPEYLRDADVQVQR